MNYQINNTTIEVLIALIIVVIISQLGIIVIGIRKNQLLRIGNVLTQAGIDKKRNIVCPKCTKKISI